MIYDFDVILGIDPGAEGAAVALSTRTPEGRVWRLRGEKAGTLPIVNLSSVAKALARSRVLAVVEEVGGRGGWHAAAVFTFGAYAGGAASAARAHGWRVEVVRPHVWQRSLTPDGTAGKPKERTAYAYSLHFPHDPLPRNRLGRHDHNVVDAAMLALYGAKKIGVPVLPWVFPNAWRLSS